MGLANRIVNAGTGRWIKPSLAAQGCLHLTFLAAYGHALNMAREIVKFPQECLKADRASAYHATFASRSLEESLQYERENAMHVINEVSLKSLAHP